MTSVISPGHPVVRDGKEVSAYRITLLNGPGCHKAASVGGYLAMIPSN